MIEMVRCLVVYKSGAIIFGADTLNHYHHLQSLILFIIITATYFSSVIFPIAHSLVCLRVRLHLVHICVTHYYFLRTRKLKAVCFPILSVSSSSVDSFPHLMIENVFHKIKFSLFLPICAQQQLHKFALT